MKEIERQFLCRAVEPAALARADGMQHIVQGYLTTGDPAVRVRRKNDVWLFTVKAGAGLVREEVEVEIDAEAGTALLAMAGDRRLEKRRYLIGPWELDVFEGKLAGLIVLELELETEDAPTPPFPDGVDVAREVTGTARYRNQALAGMEPAEAANLVRSFYGEAAR